MDLEQLEQKYGKLAIMIPYFDRPTELALLLQSLRTSDYQEFDIFIRDDHSGQQIQTYYFLNALITRMILEGHKIFIKRNEFSYGVSRNRQALVDDVFEQGNYKIMGRLDDDVIINKDYFVKLLNVLENDFDLATGVTIPFGPCMKRDPKHLKGIVNRIILDNEGNFLFNGDDCGMPYIESQILTAHHFRSCALCKSELHKKVNYWPNTKFSANGYREEELFSLRALMEGFKIGCDTQAVTYHLMTPSGGERSTMNLAPFNQQMLCEFVKENKDKIRPLTSKKEDLEPLEYLKESNLLR